ncbi:hypothetical protein G6F22_021896 [Rhizopus arrhizus]|nr:hypothetical protein G6F22_021896 [Rhizopus arrhizus]
MPSAFSEPIAAGGWGSRRSGHPWGGARAAHTPRATAPGRSRAGMWPYAKYRRRLPCRRVAAGRNPACPSIPGA